MIARLLAIMSAMAVLASSAAACGGTPPAPQSAPTSSAGPASKSPSPSGPSPSSFAGKTVSIIVCAAAGGGSDLTARLYARYLGQFLPGNPGVVVRQMPGGESTVGTNYAYFSKPDGLTVLLAAGTVYMADLLDKPGLRFNSLTEMTAMIAAPPIGDAFYFKGSVYDKPEDVLKAKGIIFGSTAGTSAMMFLAFNEILGIPLEKVVLAYGSDAEKSRAFLSGEINASSGTNANYKDFRPYADKGELKVLFQAGMLDSGGNIIRHPAFPPDYLTAPEVFEKLHGKPPSGPPFEAYRQLLGSTRSMERSLLLPPKTPNEIIRTYWQATEKMVKDPRFLKDADALIGEGAEWRAGEIMDKAFKGQFGLDPKVREWLSNLLSTKYGMVLQ